MAEKAYFFTTGGGGDGASTYTQDDLSNAMKVAAACMDDEGVAPALLNALAPTANGANSVRVATGGAMVDGKPYMNTANVDTNIPSAVGGGNTRIDRLVLRASWGATRTVRITRIAGVDAASPTAPAITQTPGTTYDIMLCQVLVNTSGAVTVTDERVFAKPGTDAIVTASITNLAVTTAKIADEAVTAAKIANRPRTFFVPLAEAWLASAGTVLAENTSDIEFGRSMPDGVTSHMNGHFTVPVDYVSGLTVRPVVIARSASSGNVRWTHYVSVTGDGEIFSVGELNQAAIDTAILGSTTKILSGHDISSVSAVGDLVNMRFERLGAHANDTVGDIVYFVGWHVTYTADS